MFQRFKSLVNLRVAYLDELVVFISSRPFLCVLANLFIIPLVQSKHGLKKLVDRLRNPVHIAAEKDSVVRTFSGIREIPDKPDVLLIVEAGIPHCFRYRVQQKIEQLQSLNLNVKWLKWNDDLLASEALNFAHIVLFYRVPAFDSVVQLLKKARALNKMIIYDVDDLIFDETVMRKNIELFSDLTKKEQQELIRGAALYHKAISLCDYSIASTPALCHQLEKIIPAFLHRNVLDKEILNFIQYQQQPELNRDYISIFYGSGTKTHNHDFQLIKKPLLKILHNYEQVRLTIIGHLILPEEFAPFLHRIDRIALLSSAAYWQVLQYADINLAPLQPGVFADSKSEIKWLEAAIMKIPSVVSNTQTYQEVIENGKTAYLADSEDEWYQYLSALVTNKKKRKAMAECAYQYAWEFYHPDKAAANLRKIFSTIIKLSPQRFAFSGKQQQPEKEKKPRQKKKVVFVNVCYPPDGIGGATAIVKNQAELLSEKYADDFSVSVFSVDIQATFQNAAEYYQLREYLYHGVPVTSIAIPPAVNIDRRYQDQTIEEIFFRYIKFQKADIIHFHSIQRLTASIIDVALKLNIASLVTLHDSWWLCDRQFMINHLNVDCKQLHVDPMVCAQCIEDSNESMIRRSFLAERLNKVDRLLAVSEYQRRLYAENEFKDIVLHHNGIVMASPIEEQNAIDSSGTAKQLQLAYVGGVCTHKGYYFLKSVVEKIALHNCQLTVVDFSLAAGQSKNIKWGDNSITMIPKIAFDKMPDFYAKIDVLLVPSLWRESFGLISREAALQGVWVVAANAGGLAEDIIEGVNGHVFEQSNAIQLTEILLKMDSRVAQYKNIGRRKGSDEIISMEQNVAELVSIYQTL